MCQNEILNITLFDPFPYLNVTSSNSDTSTINLSTHDCLFEFKGFFGAFNVLCVPEKTHESKKVWHAYISTADETPSEAVRHIFLLKPWFSTLKWGCIPYFISTYHGLKFLLQDNMELNALTIFFAYCFTLDKKQMSRCDVLRCN